MMEAIMTDAQGGEGRAASRRRSFWRFFWTGMVVALVVGGIAGTARSLNEFGLVPPLLTFPILVAALGFYTWFSIVFFRRVDELEVADNLWASLIGLYFYIALMPSWAFLHYFGWVGAPDHWAIWAATMAATAIVYGVRKWRAMN